MTRWRSAKTTQRALLVVLLISAAIGSLGPTAQASVEVTAQGVAAVVEYLNPDDIREEAILDAKRRAAEVGAGVFLHAETRVENLVLVSATVETRVDAIIVDYEILREWEDALFLHVEILALVDTVDAGLLLHDLGIIIKAAGDPRIVFRVEEERLGEEVRLSVAEAILRQEFERSGFTIVEPDQATGSVMSAFDTTDPGAALELAQAFDADVVIVGSVSTEPLAAIQMGMFTWHNATATVDVQAYHRKTGELLASAYASSKSPDAKLSVEEAAVSATETASMQVLPELLYEIIAKLNTVNGAGLRAIRLTIEDLGSFDEATCTEEALNTLREVTSVDLVQYGPSLTAFDIKYMGPTDALAAELISEHFADTLGAYCERDQAFEIVALDSGSIHARKAR
ncbi:MAG: hypothetical protein WBC63_06710 [Candidatus Bipolaricaulia bacterium]